MLSEETIIRDYSIWCEYLKKYDCLSDALSDALKTDFGEKVKNASWALNTQSGGGKGTMLHVVLTSLCPIAAHINNDAFGINSKQKDKHPLLKVDMKSLMKVLLLQHLSKAEMFVPSTEQWKINKGMVYDFNPDLETIMKLGARSVFLCMKYCITLTEEEYEAMLILDKEEDKVNSFMNSLSEIVKISNQFAAIEVYRKING